MYIRNQNGIIYELKTKQAKKNLNECVRVKVDKNGSKCNKK